MPLPFDEEIVLQRVSFPLRREAVQDEIDRLELMIQAAGHSSLRAHLLPVLEAYRGELEAIEDLDTRVQVELPS